MHKTTLKKLTIKKFRALNDVHIEFGTHVTVICGKNGTSKSSILGIAAQIFSFEKDYEKNEKLQYLTITNATFKSLPSEHFRFSDRFDIPGALDVQVEIHDGYTCKDGTAELELAKRTIKRKEVARPVVRKNSIAVGNKSRNFTHPVIYLSLNRLQPIASRDYTVCDYQYLNQPEHKAEFIKLNNELLNKISATATSTSGSINSAVAHGENYDQDSVSAGEDNVGQIILALMSFRKLKEEYKDYKGGLLLIDEADAGLFPAAQTKLLEMLDRECGELKLQVIMTSHSPTMIEKTYDLSRRYQRKFKTIYLSDTYGPVRAMQDFSWPDIYADLNTITVAASDGDLLPRINIYFEDKEGSDLFNVILFRSKLKKFLNQLSEVTLGCTNYMHLVRSKIPEFASKSIIVLDADVKGAEQMESIILLPGHLPPDQLIFEYLYNLPPNDPIWRNAQRFTRPVFTNCAAEIRNALNINQDQVTLQELIDGYRIADDPKKVKLREIFKRFYKNEQFQRFLSISGTNNPWKRWIKDNKPECDEFLTQFKSKLNKTMRSGHGVDEAKLSSLQ